jgi:hypothetical protein
MFMDFVLTDGLKFIKQNEHGDPVKETQVAKATVFESMVAANNYLQTNKMIKVNSDNGKNRFHVEELEGGVHNKDIKMEKALEEELRKEINGLDGVYQDYADIKLADEDNKHIYTGKTALEDEDFDLYEFLHNALNVFSQLENFIENMTYLERETDLKLLDLRHYKRDKRTKLNAIQMQKLAYYEQELERERKEYKTNRILASIFSKDINRIKNRQFVKIIDKIANSEYRYRRLDKGEIEDIISGKKQETKLKAV